MTGFYHKGHNISENKLHHWVRTQTKGLHKAFPSQGRLLRQRGSEANEGFVFRDSQRTRTTRTQASGASEGQMREEGGWRTDQERRLKSQQEDFGCPALAQPGGEEEDI